MAALSRPPRPPPAKMRFVRSASVSPPAITDLIGGQVHVAFDPNSFINRVCQGWHAARLGGNQQKTIGCAARPSAISCPALKQPRGKASARRKIPQVQ